MMVCEQFSQRSTWPPSAAVRQRSIADITFNWSRLTWPALAERHAAPVVAEDIRDLQLRTGHCRGRLRRRLHLPCGSSQLSWASCALAAPAGRAGSRRRRSCRWRRAHSASWCLISS